jgi:hypothetical protein
MLNLEFVSLNFEYSILNYLSFRFRYPIQPINNVIDLLCTFHKSNIIDLAPML